jgi:hypothetical protein
MPHSAGYDFVYPSLRPMACSDSFDDLDGSKAAEACANAQRSVVHRHQPIAFGSHKANCG